MQPLSSKQPLLRDYGTTNEAELEFQTLSPQSYTVSPSGRLDEILEYHWSTQAIRRISFAYLFMLVICCGALVLQMLDIQRWQGNPAVPIITGTLAVYCGIASALTVLCKGKLSLAIHIISSLVVSGGCSLGLILGTQKRIHSYDGLATILNVVLTVYLFLLSPWINTIVGCLISTLHIVIMIAGSFKPFIGLWQTASMIAILIGANGIGSLYSFRETWHRRSLITRLKSVVQKRTIVENEKGRQEQLLLSIIPPYLAEQVKRQLMQRASKTQQTTRSSNEQPKVFHDLHVQLHHNVSILFADIVNFTPLTASLTAAQLVDTLNALYARFDQLAQENQCMRIKILGDCYYCVSGMPVSRPNHADNCVRMGISMIKAIRTVRDATGVDVDMRIGVNTGDVLCGILGLRKWQYDIWSDDVTIANHMESSGRPGLVHITGTTYHYLSGEYEIESAKGKRRPDEYIDNLEIDTYFIKPPHAGSVVQRRPSAGSCVSQDCVSVISAEDGRTTGMDLASPAIRSKVTKVAEFWGADTPFSNLSKRVSNDIMNTTSLAIIEEHLRQQQTLLYDRNIITKRLASLFNCDQHSMHHSRDAARRKASNKSPIQWTFFLGLCLIIAFVLASSVSRNLSSIVIFGTTGGCILLYALYSWMEHYRPKIATMTRVLSNYLQATAFTIFILVLVSFAAIFPMFRCISDSDENSSSGLCTSATFVVCCCQLVIAYIGLLQNLWCLLRSLLIIVITFTYIIILEVSKTSYMQQMPVLHRNNSSMSIVEELSEDQLQSFFPENMWAHLIVLLLILVFRNMQLEQEHRTDWGCLSAFKNEQEDVETMQDINTILLQNILPAHVAQYFLSSSRNIDVLYHENHENVCVMFASIPNFQDFWKRFDNEHKLECLRLLNEIICEFDTILSKPKFSNVEKIKTVGSTYMAATGLHPAQGGCNKERNVGIMVEFAFGMANLLEHINHDAFQIFQLRFGLCYGPVIAGVIGAQKPQYDIWGNTVNMSARMDTHGEMGKIHMTSETADALVTCGYQVRSRGKIKVKGVKDPQETFFVVTE